MEHREYNPNEAWDEYRWERYLRENDQRCERFATLLERHLTSPQRNRAIADGMGWNHLFDGLDQGDATMQNTLFLELIDLMLSADELEDESHAAHFPEDMQDFTSFADGELNYGVPSLFSEEDERMPDKGNSFEPPAPGDTIRGSQSQDLEPIEFGPISSEDADFQSGMEDFEEIDDDEDDDEDEDASDLSSHPLCDLATTYKAWLERIFFEEPDLLLEPAAVRLTAYSAICGAKINAALEGDEFEDLGMTIAYLKRGLKAINTALDAHFLLNERQVMPQTRSDEMRARIFRIRDGIIELMGYYRLEWMRRIDE